MATPQGPKKNTIYTVPTPIILVFFYFKINKNKFILLNYH